MGTDYASIQVWSDHATPVGEPGETITVTALSGGTVFYGDRQVSSGSHLGSLTVGQSVDVTVPTNWLRSGSSSTVLLNGVSQGIPASQLPASVVTSSQTQWQQAAQGAHAVRAGLYSDVATFNSELDPSAFFGWNVGPAAVAGQSSLLLGMEHNYNDGSGHNKAEWYGEWNSDDGATQLRPIGFQIDKVSKAVTGIDLNSTAGVAIQNDAANSTYAQFVPNTTTLGAPNNANNTLHLQSNAAAGTVLVMDGGTHANALLFVVQSFGTEIECAGIPALFLFPRGGMGNPVDVTVPTGSLIVGATAPLANSATDGFLYLPTVAGTPTGTPTAVAGTKPIVYDITANKLWVYNGAWKSAAFA